MLIGRYFKVFWFLVLFLVGCQASVGYYRGATALPETIVSLVGQGEDAQRWQDLYVVIDYKFNEKGGQLEIEGVFDFADFPQGLLLFSRFFELRLFLLDKNNQVLDDHDLIWASGFVQNQRTPFKKTIPIPQNAVAVSFGYTGTLVDEDGAHEQVWKLPQVRQGMKI
jgi:hypothetical protein